LVSDTYYYIMVQELTNISNFANIKYR